MLAGNTGALIEGNEIGHNSVDGFRDTYGGRGTVVRRNYIHHHFDSMAHPDNIQTHNDVKDLTVDSNLLVCGGQSVMMATTDGVTFRNNVILGSAANMLICGHNSTVNATFERNTLDLWASSLWAFAGGTGYKMQGNIAVHRGGAIFYGVPAEATFDSKGNVFWAEPGLDAGRAWRGSGGSSSTLQEFQQRTGWETGSEFKDPQFKSTPAHFSSVVFQRRDECTTSKLVLRRPEAFKPGDRIEVNFDGVARTVKSVDGDAIVFDPPMDHVTVFTFVCNWKDREDFVYDYSSPLNDRYGSTISVPAFMRCDFDGDGRRDVPEYGE
jgi:hypothetical protein